MTPIPETLRTLAEARHMPDCNARRKGACDCGLESDIRSALLYAAEMVEWQPIETAPKDGTWILGINNRGNQSVIIWSIKAPHWSGEGFADGWIHPFSSGRLSSFWNGECGSVPTHWRTLPPPPASEGGE